MKRCLERRKLLLLYFKALSMFEHTLRDLALLSTQHLRGVSSLQDEELPGQTSGYHRINSMRARMYYCMYLHTRGRAGKQRKGEKLHFALSKGLHCQFYLGKAVAEAAE